MARLEDKCREALDWLDEHPGAPLPRLMATAYSGQPLPPEPLQFK